MRCSPDTPSAGSSLIRHNTQTPLGASAQPASGPPATTSQVPPTGGQSPLSRSSSNVPLGNAPSSSAAAPAGDVYAENKPKIQLFEQRLGASAGKNEESWKRTPNSSPNGACHVKSFHCKLNPESLEYMDRQMNEWLDAHPGYDVKFTTSVVGEWQGKLKEPSLIVQVWI